MEGTNIGKDPEPKALIPSAAKLDIRKPMREESDRNNSLNESETYFIPNLFKDNPSKPSLINATDPFITDHSANEYCSLFATDEKDNLPNYLHHFKECIENVLDISNDVFDDIAKVHVEREEKYKELEEEEEKQKAHQQSLQQKEKDSMDYTVNRMLSTRQYYVKRCCPVKIPFKSTLTHEEHDFYIRCFFKFQIRSPVNPLEEKEYEQYMSMQNRVFGEQSCMMNFSYKVATMVLNSYNEVPEVIDKYIKEHVSHRCERALNYPSYYKREVDIPLKASMLKESPGHFQFTHMGHLLSLGNIPWLNIPSLQVKTSLPKDDDTMMNKKNPICDNDFKKCSYLYKCPVSEDPNAEYLAQTYKVSVVITPSAFKTIVDNQEEPYDKEWNIPVKIKSYKVKDEHGNETDMRIVYIDKPLVNKSWLPLQKKYTYYKKAAKVVFSGSLKRPPRYFRLRNPLLKKKKQENRNQLVSYDECVFSDIGSDERPYKKFAPSTPSVSKAKNSEKKLLSDELESDLFLSEDEEEKSNIDKTSNKNVSNISSDITPDTATVTSAVGGSTTTSTTTSTTNSFNTTITTSIEPVITTTPNNNNENPINDSSRRVSLPKAAIPPPLNYRTNKRSDPKVFSNTETTSTHQSSFPLKVKSEGNSAYKNEGFLDNLLDKQDSFLKLKTSPSKTKNKETVDTMLKTLSVQPTLDLDRKDNFGTMPWQNNIHRDWEENVKLKFPPENCDTNIHYQLFSFENCKQNPCKEDSQKPIRILVRHSVHGLLKRSRDNKRNFKRNWNKAPPSQAFVVVPKVENQIYFGAEVNSSSEIVQQWADLLLRPNTRLLQVRVCTESGDVVMTQEKNLDVVLKEGKQQHINFNPQSVFTTLNVLLNTLEKMSSGEYLLHHSPKTEAFMKLMKSHGRNEFVVSSMDLHKIYSDKALVSKKYRTSPWLAIDTHVFTPFHLTHHKIPATFPMENLSKLNKKEKNRRKAKASSKLSMEGYQ